MLLLIPKAILFNNNFYFSSENIPQINMLLLLLLMCGGLLLLLLIVLCLCVSLLFCSDVVVVVFIVWNQNDFCCLIGIMLAVFRGGGFCLCNFHCCFFELLLISLSFIFCFHFMFYVMRLMIGGR